jgi:hypothetical protein
VTCRPAEPLLHVWKETFRLTWSIRSARWDALDPLVIGCTPIAFVLQFAVVVRMFETRLLSWS